MADVTPMTADSLGKISNVKREIISEFIFESFTDGITAFAGGGQSGAVPILTELSRVTTVATIGYSVMLPPAAAGAMHQARQPSQKLLMKGCVAAAPSGR